MRRTTSLCLALAALVLTVAAPLPAQHNPTAEKAAQQSATAWLALTDAGKYPESWNTASDAFKRALTRDKWVATVKPVRSPLGKVTSRKLKACQYAKDPPRAPKGEYTQIQYDANFEKKPGAVETIVEIRDKDGKWRTDGYFIR